MTDEPCSLQSTVMANDPGRSTRKATPPTPAQTISVTLSLFTRAFPLRGLLPVRPPPSGLPLCNLPLRTEDSLLHPHNLPWFVDLIVRGCTTSSSLATTATLGAATHCCMKKGEIKGKWITIQIQVVVQVRKNKPLMILPLSE
ncbi:hypothetical protein BS78_10G132700 [Paspalum vaginatum]|nr:hypothetical protein BS78_10G132700 [Paspalum vaginatum]